MEKKGQGGAGVGKKKPKVKPRVGKLVKTERGSILSFLDSPPSPPSSSSFVPPPSNTPTLSPDPTPLSPSCVLLSSSPSLSPAYSTDPLAVHSTNKLTRKGSTFSSALLNSSLNSSLNAEKAGTGGSDYLMDVWESQGSQEERGREGRGW